MGEKDFHWKSWTGCNRFPREIALHQSLRDSESVFGEMWVGERSVATMTCPSSSSQRGRSCAHVHILLLPHHHLEMWRASFAPHLEILNCLKKPTYKLILCDTLGFLFSMHLLPQTPLLCNVWITVLPKFLCCSYVSHYNLLGGPRLTGILVLENSHEKVLKGEIDFSSLDTGMDRGMGPSNLVAVCLFPSDNLAPTHSFPSRANHQDHLEMWL